MAENKQWLWGIHAGETGQAERLFLINGFVGLGWPQMGHLGLLPPTRAAFKQKLKETYPSDAEGAHNINTGQLYRFVHEMKVGDPVAFRPKLTAEGAPLIFLGHVVGPYVYNPFLDPAYPNLRRVEWLRSLPPSQFSQGARDELAAYLSLFQIDTHAAEFLTALAESK